VSPRRVEEAACIVPEPPKDIPVPFTVIEEFWRAELGRFKVDEAAVNGIPVAPVITKPLLPIPNVVEVEKRVESCAVVVFHKRGRSAEIEVVPKVEELPDPHAPLALTKSPPVEACTQFPEVSPETLKLPFIVEDADTKIPFAFPFIKLGNINPSVRFVILHGTEVVARAERGAKSPKDIIKAVSSFFILSRCEYIIVWGY
jgi:hypothetical protein